MAWVFASTIPGERAGALAKANPSAAPSSLTIHDHQQGALSDHAPLPHAHSRSGARVSSPRSIRNWRAQSASLSGCVRLSHFVRGVGSRRSRAQSVRYQLHQNLAVAVIHHLTKTLSSVRLAVSQDSEASNGRVPNSCGAFPKTKGEFPNVGC